MTMPEDVFISDIEDLRERMLNLESESFDPNQGSGNLQEVVLDHGEWKTQVGFDSSPRTTIGDPITLEDFQETIVAENALISTVTP